MRLLALALPAVAGGASDSSVCVQAGHQVGGAVLRIEPRQEPLLDPAEREAFVRFVRQEFECNPRTDAKRPLEKWLRGFRRGRRYD